MAISNQLGYNTHILGTVKAASETKTIVVYNKNELSDNPEYTRLSLYNISSVWDVVVRDGRYLRLNRKSAQENFIYEYEKFPQGFNIILYLTSADTPIGYTEFVNVQGLVRDINISINLYSTTLIDPDEFSVTLTNSLVELKTSISPVLKDTGDGLDLYPPEKAVRDSVEKTITRNQWVSTISSHIKKDSLDTLYTTGGVSQRGRMMKLGVIQDIPYNQYSNPIKNFQVTEYNGDLVMYTWWDGCYNVFSLLENNRFGSPIIYTKSKNGYFTLPESETIDYVTGKYIVTESGRFYDISRGEWVMSGMSSVIVPSTNGRLWGIPEHTNLAEYIPDLNNTFLDIIGYSATISPLTLIRQVSEWWIFGIQRTPGLYVMSGPFGYLYLTKDDLPGVMVLGGRVVMVKNENYYTIYNFSTPRGLATESARVILENGKLVELDDTGIMICDSGEERNEVYNKYRKEGIISWVFVGEDLIGSELEVYRRAPLYTVTVPEIVATWGGLIFYTYTDKDNIKKLSYL